MHYPCNLRKIFKMYNYIMHATKKKIPREARLKSIKTVHNLNYLPAHAELENLCFVFCSPNGMHITCVYLQCGLFKCHFFSKATFIRVCISDYRAKTISWLIYLSFKPNPNGCRLILCKRKLWLQMYERVVYFQYNNCCT